MFDTHNWRLLSRRQCDQDWLAAAETLSYYLNDPSAALASWAGSKLPLLRRKVALAMDYLEHEDYLLRLTSVFLLRDYWPKTEFTASAVAVLPFSDHNAIVRGIALDSLSCFYGWISDPDDILVSLFHLTAEYKKFLMQYAKERVMITKSVRSKWVETIGPLAHEMLGDLSLVEQSLQSSDSQVRHTALLVMATEMQPNSYVVSIANQIIQSRLETSALKKAAVGVLAHYRQITQDASFDNLFVELVRDGSCPDQVRATAYLTLFEIRGLCIPADVITRVGLEEFRFPDDVDWSLVDSFSG